MKIFLLWITAFSVMLYAMGLDSLSLTALLIWGIVNILLILTSYVFLSEKDVMKYSGAKFIDKLLKMEDEDYE